MGSGLHGALLHLFNALPEERHEIDGVDEQRREAAISHGVGDDLPGEREDQPRALDHDDRMQLGFGNVLQAEYSGVVELEFEQDGRRCLRRTFQKEADFELAGRQLFGVHIHLNIDVRTLLLRRERTRRVRVFERKILGVLGEYIELGKVFRRAIFRHFMLH